MLTDAEVRALDGAWAPARADGALGGAAVHALYDHAAGFVPAASVVFGPPRSGPVVDELAGYRCIDVGTGAGVPGVLLARRFPASQWRLVDASARRCDFARRAVRALELGSRVEVVHARVDELAHTVGWRGSADLVTARLFGAPAEVAECALPLLVPGGVLVVSASSATLEVWQRADLAMVDATLVATWEVPAPEAAHTFVALQSISPVDVRYPRRPAHRRRDPLF